MNKNVTRRPPVTGEKGGKGRGQHKAYGERKTSGRPARNENEGRSHRGSAKSGERKERFAEKTEGFGRKKNFRGARSERSEGFSGRKEGFEGRRASFGPKREGAPKRDNKYKRTATPAGRTEKKSYNPAEKKYVYKERVHKIRSVKEQPADDTTVRLNKFIANSGVCSRREADTFISTGLVTVNGEIVTEMGTKIDPVNDDVRFNGERLKGEQKVYILMNKPKNFVTTLSDPHAEKTVMDLISKEKCKERVIPVGRLDKATTGVLLFSNDGQMIEKLTHPSFQVKKIYHVSLDKNLKRTDFDAILNGLQLEDGEIHADALSYVEEDNSQVGIEIHSGRNRIVRRIFEHLGYRVKKLDRVYFAGLTKKNLKRGQWRFLEESEINMLKMGAWL